MLSKKDILRELGKELCIYPFIPDNIKENSINVSVSEYAWTQGGGTAYWYGGKDFRTDSNSGKPRHAHTFKPGQKSVFIAKERNGGEEKKFLILFPHQTTNVETLETIGIGKRLGGAVHSKVGIVSKGIGDCGTMLGPGYCGHLLFSLHNITDNIIALEIGETFGSLTFDYLKTPVERESTTVPSHTDKLLQMKSQLSDEDHRYLSEDWKSNFNGIKNKMKCSGSFKESVPLTFWSEIKRFINKRNIILSCIAIVAFVGLYIGARMLDKNLIEKIWVDRYYNLVGVSIVASVFSIYSKFYKK